MADSDVPGGGHAAVRRKPGVLATVPGWDRFVYDPALFAPMPDTEMAGGNWPA